MPDSSAIAERARKVARRYLWRLRPPTSVGQWRVTAATARSQVPESDFTSLFFDHRVHQIEKWAHYLDAYAEQFGPLRLGRPQPDGSLEPVRLLEIGVSYGGSVQLWRDYFGPKASIFGIDIDERCAAIQGGDLNVRIGSQADPAFLRRTVEEMGGVDIVLDDGSHISKHQKTCFQTLFPLLSEGGLYVVEDLHTAYWPDFQGGYRRAGTFIETAKALIDDMHAWYHDRGDSQGVLADRTIQRMTFYDSMVFISKGQRTRPMITTVGDVSF